MTTHLEDMVGSDIDTVKIWNTAETEFTRLEYDHPSSPCFFDRNRAGQLTTNDNACRSEPPAYTLIATQTPKVGQSRDRTSAPDFTAIIMTLLRLERNKTDVLITINVPHIKGEYDEAEVDLELGKQGKLIGDAVEYSARIWESLKIKDYGVFGDP